MSEKKQVLSSNCLTIDNRVMTVYNIISILKVTF